MHTTYKGVIFLDFGAKHPNEVFYVYLPAAVAATWEDADVKSLQGLAGKTVAVTGKVKRYKGKPEIVLDKRSQVSP